jgi:hypothetical protein
VLVESDNDAKHKCNSNNRNRTGTDSRKVKACSEGWDGRSEGWMRGLHRLKRQSRREGCLDMRTASARFACCKPTVLGLVVADSRVEGSSGF